jgi:parallel beta-helix repeat protein
MNKLIALTFLLSTFLIGCNEQPKNQKSSLTPQNIEQELLGQLIDAQDGDIIELPEGFFEFTRPLTLDGINNITIKGAGMHKTILSFKNQVVGAEGLFMKGDGLTLEGFTVQDTKGDAIKVSDSKNIIFRDVNTTWTDGAKEENGGYGLYPVSCENVLMEKCEASYSSDAGIYVGQSINVIVRDCYAHHNVAGIEIENCKNVEAYNNLAENNTAGFLVFDMPNLPQPYGENVRVYNNTVRDNNHKNFSPEGGVVNLLPPGTGMLVVGHRNIEIFDNTITGYKTMGLAIVSYVITRRDFIEDSLYRPYYWGVNIHNNTFERSGALPDLTKEFGQMVSTVFNGKTQDILIDGIFDPLKTVKNGNYTGSEAVCIKDNKGDDLRFVNLNVTSPDAGVMDLKKSFNRNLSPFDCSIEIKTEAPGAWLANK